MKKTTKTLGIILAISMIFALAACNKAPEPIVPSETEGLVLQKEMETKYTDRFKVAYYNDGYKILTDSTGQEILYIPEGKEAPKGYETMQAVKGPVTKIGAFQIPIVTAVRGAGGLDKVNMVTYAQDKWTIPEINSGIGDGSILFVGAEGEPDFELIKSNKPDIIFLNGESHELGEVRKKINELGIVWASVSSHLEEHPLGRVEWQQFIAAFLDTEEYSNTSFKVQEESYATISAATKDKEHPKVGQFYIMGDSIYVKNGGSYVAKTIEAAGGEYLYKDIGADKGGNTKMTPEDFFIASQEADVLIYDNASASKIQTLSALLEGRPYLNDIKAIKEGRIWGMQSGYNQHIDKLGQITSFLSTAIYDDVKAPTQNDYYKPLVD